MRVNKEGGLKEKKWLFSKGERKVRNRLKRDEEKLKGKTNML